MLAKVISYKGEYARVETIVDSACGGCKECSKGQGGKKLLAKGDKFYPINSIVNIEISSKNLLLASFIAYGVPVFVLLAIVIIGGLLKVNEAYTILFALVLIVSYYLYIHNIDSKLSRSGKFIAVITEGKENVFDGKFKINW